MAVILMAKSTAISMKLNNGTDSKGQLKTVALNLGSLKEEDFTSEDLQKAQNIISALEPCLDKVVHHTEKTHVDTLQTE